MAATEELSRRVREDVRRHRRVGLVALLVAFAWLGGCAPLAPVSQPAVRAALAPPPPTDREAAPAPPPGIVGGGVGSRATGSTEVPITLPSGRAYVVHVPAVDDGRPRPLVLALHGLYLSWQNMAWTSGLSEYADGHGFLVAYGVGAGGSWNVGAGCCGSAATRKLDDVGYLAAVVADVSSRVAVDRSRVYLVGFSAGESMALRAQCARPDLFAASAGSSGALLGGCRPGGPVRALHLHGRQDRTVPYVGGFSEALRRSVAPAREFGVRLARQGAGTVATVLALRCGHLWPRRDNACRFDATGEILRWMSRFHR